MRAILIIGLLMLIGHELFSQDADIRILFYNTENLFDTLDAPETNDAEFLPSSKLGHNGQRYALKLAHLAKVIDSSFFGAAPELLGLCEVENRTVVLDLLHTVSIQHHLDVIHIESPDQRGIDNALLYDTLQFRLLTYGLRKIDLGEGNRPTRGILWAVFTELQTGYPFAVLVNHWPSRSGGEEESRPKRLTASSVAVALIDSLTRSFDDCSVVVMGDLNDHPDDESVLNLSRCANPENDPCMVNMHAHYVGTDSGSHAYRGQWGVLDQILVNRTLLDVHSWTPDRNGGEFVRFDWMMYEDPRSHLFFPNRFYGSSQCYEGYSDHLPAKLRLHLP